MLQQKLRLRPCVKISEKPAMAGYTWPPLKCFAKQRLLNLFITKSKFPCSTARQIVEARMEGRAFLEHLGPARLPSLDLLVSGTSGPKN